MYMELCPFLLMNDYLSKKKLLVKKVFDSNFVEICKCLSFFWFLTEKKNVKACGPCLILVLLLTALLLSTSSSVVYRKVT